MNLQLEYSIGMHRGVPRLYALAVGIMELQREKTGQSQIIATLRSFCRPTQEHLYQCLRDLIVMNQALRTGFVVKYYVKLRSHVVKSRDDAVKQRAGCSCVVWFSC